MVRHERMEQGRDPRNRLTQSQFLTTHKDNSMDNEKFLTKYTGKVSKKEKAQIQHSFHSQNLSQNAS